MAQIHGNIHFTFGGAGGDNCAAVDQQLQSTYGLTDTQLVLLTTAAQGMWRAAGCGVGELWGAVGWLRRKLSTRLISQPFSSRISCILL